MVEIVSEVQLVFDIVFGFDSFSLKHVNQDNQDSRRRTDNRTADEAVFIINTV